MPNNFIQRPRLFNPAQSYQQGAVNRANYETGQQNQQINAFNLQRAQERAPIQDEQDRLGIQKTLQTLDAGKLEAATVKAQQLQRGLDSYMSLPIPQQAAEYTQFRSTILGMGGDPNNWPEQYDPQMMQQQKRRLLMLAGEIEKENEKAKYGLNPFYYKVGDQLHAGQLSSSGGMRGVAMPPGATPVEPMTFLNRGLSYQPAGTKTGTLGEEIPIDVAEKKQQEGLGTAAASVATEAFKRLPAIQGNISKLKRAKALISKGANTGVIQSMLPTFKAASVQLNQLRNELGLDVVGAVTFGALSAGELSMALDTALPDRLSPPELGKWLDEKIYAQTRLYTYLKEQASFLSKGGNTVADWYAKKEDEMPVEDSPAAERPVTELSDQEIIDGMPP